MQAVVFIPGLLSDEALFADQMQALQAQGFAVQAHPSFGADNIPAIAASILEKLPAHFALCGLSMGGYVALEIFRQAPARVTHLMLLNTSARADTPAHVEKRSALIQLAQIGRFRGVTLRLLPLLINEKHLHNAAMTQVIFDMAERVGRDKFITQQQAMMTRRDSRDLLPNIRVPTLVVGGVDDQIAPPELQQEIAENIAGASLHILDDCGHLCTLEQADRVSNLVLAFLEK